MCMLKLDGGRWESGFSFFGAGAGKGQVSNCSSKDLLVSKGEEARMIHVVMD